MPEIEGIVLWDDPDDDDDGPTAGDRSLPVTGGGVFEPGGGRQHENENPIGGSEGRGSVGFPFYDEEGGTGGWGGSRDQGPGLDFPIEVPEDGRPHLFEQEYIPFEDPIDRLPQYFPQGGPFWDNEDIPERRHNRGTHVEWRIDPNRQTPTERTGPILLSLTLKDGSVMSFTHAQAKTVNDALKIIQKQSFLDFLKIAGLLEKFENSTDRLPIVPGVAGVAPCDGTRSAAVVHKRKDGTKLEKPVMYLCPEFFAGSSTKDDERRKNTILHEIVHALDSTEIDSYIIEYLFGYRSHPFPPWPTIMNDPSKFSQLQRNETLKFWCQLRYDGENKSEIHDVNGNVYIVGEFFTINVTTGEMTLNGTFKSPYDANISQYLPPASWWLADKPANGC